MRQLIETHDIVNGPQPEFTGPMGMAWSVVLPEPQNEAEKTSLCGWLIFTPQANIFWQYHLITLIHLRDIPGVPPAKLFKPEATHEIMLLAIDPKSNARINPQDSSTLRHILSPPDFNEQVTLPSDEQAMDVVKMSVEKCVNGELIPDSDYTKSWQLFLQKEESKRALPKSLP
jgi:hypothetical protein